MQNIKDRISHLSQMKKTMLDVNISDEVYFLNENLNLSSKDRYPVYFCFSNPVTTEEFTLKSFRYFRQNGLIFFFYDTETSAAINTEIIEKDARLIKVYEGLIEI